MSEKARGKQVSRHSPQLDPTISDHRHVSSHAALETTSTRPEEVSHLVDEFFSGVEVEESFTTAHLKHQISEATAAIGRGSESHSATAADKDRIRELEQEVQRLREEVRIL